MQPAVYEHSRNGISATPHVAHEKRRSSLVDTTDVVDACDAASGVHAAVGGTRGRTLGGSEVD